MQATNIEGTPFLSGLLHSRPPRAGYTFALKAILALGLVLLCSAQFPSPYKVGFAIAGVTVTAIALLGLGLPFIVRQIDLKKVVPYGTPYTNLCWLHALLQFLALGNQLEKLQASESTTVQSFANVVEKIRGNQPIEESEITGLVKSLQEDQERIPSKNWINGKYEDAIYGKTFISATEVFMTLYTRSKVPLTPITFPFGPLAEVTEGTTALFPNQLIYRFGGRQIDLDKEGCTLFKRENHQETKRYRLEGYIEHLENHFIFRKRVDSESHEYFSNGWRTLVKEDFPWSPLIHGTFLNRSQNLQIGLFTLVE